MNTRPGGVAVLVALVLVLTTATAWAHGGGTPRLTNVEVGPYWVSVWTQPDPLRVGEAHITVAVSEPSASTSARREAGSPVLDATVDVAFKPLDHVGETLTTRATREGAVNKLLYEADLNLPEVGHWQVIITVQGPQGSGSADFEVEVAPPSAFSWTWIGALGLAGLAAVWAAQRLQSYRSRE